MILTRAVGKRRAGRDRTDLGKTVDAKFSQLEENRPADTSIMGFEPLERAEEVDIERSPIRFVHPQSDSAPLGRIDRAVFVFVVLKFRVVGQDPDADFDIADFPGSETRRCVGRGCVEGIDLAVGEGVQVGRAAEVEGSAEEGEEEEEEPGDAAGRAAGTAAWACYFAVSGF
jgi:hypothetical protein